MNPEAEREDEEDEGSLRKFNECGVGTYSKLASGISSPSRKFSVGSRQKRSGIRLEEGLEKSLVLSRKKEDKLKNIQITLERCSKVV